MACFIELNTTTGHMTFNIDVIKTIVYGIDGTATVWVSDHISHVIRKEEVARLRAAVKQFVFLES